jgi:hypothetical protein
MMIRKTKKNYECPSIFRKTEEEKQEEAKSAAAAAAGAEILRVPIHHHRCKHKQRATNNTKNKQTVRPHFISGARLS